MFTRRQIIASLSTLPTTAAPLWLTACSSAPSAQAEQSAPLIPMRDFFRNSLESDHKISPDGQYLSWLAPYERRMNVYVRPISDPKASPVRVTSETERSVEGYFWKGQRIIYSKDSGGDENFHLYSVNLQGGELKDLTPGAQVKAEVIDELRQDDQHLIIGHNRRDPKVLDVYRINIFSGAETLVARNPGNVDEWWTDHGGRVRAGVTHDGLNKSLIYRDHEGEPFRVLLTTSFRDDVKPLLFTFDNRRLYVLSNRGRDKKAIFEFDPKTAKEGRLLAEHPDVDMEGLVQSRRRQTLTSARYITWRREHRYFDAQTEAMHRRVQAQLPGYGVYFTSHNDAEDRFVVVASSDRVPTKVYLYAASSDKLEPVANAQPWLNEADLVVMKPIQYAARDGLTIHGYLTIPKGRAARQLPLIVYSHGGPWDRDQWGYNPIVQFLANRGYAVLQPNFRGSLGYGRRFWEAGFGQWGGTMQDDITDGVQWLIREGVADPRRIGIFGISYGGYAALMGIVKTPDLYAAAVDYVGVSNLFTFLDSIPPYWENQKIKMYEQIGHPVKDKDLMTRTSPALNADRIKTPLLVAQGARDPRVVKSESDQMVAALRKRGVQVEYIVKDDEGHGFRNEENSFEFFEAMEAFLLKHMPPNR